MTVLQILHYLYLQSQPRPKHKGGVFRGEKNGNWKGGKTKCRGYIYVKTPGHPYAVKGYVLEHRLIMEKQLGRYLEPSEIVHHINEIKDDNRLENLQLMTDAEHRRFHAQKVKFWLFRKKLRQTDDTSDDSDTSLL